MGFVFYVQMKMYSATSRFTLKAFLELGGLLRHRSVFTDEFLIYLHDQRRILYGG